jgi:protein Mpv17
MIVSVGDAMHMQGWTVFEILKYAPLHNWSAYEDALQSNPLLAKMMISGIVYSIGDWFAQVRSHEHTRVYFCVKLFTETLMSVLLLQCYEGKPLLDISRERIFRSGLVGFCLHGSLSHFYYYLCEVISPPLSFLKLSRTVGVTG